MWSMWCGEKFGPSGVWWPLATAANQRLYVGTYDHIFIQPSTSAHWRLTARLWDKNAKDEMMKNIYKIYWHIKIINCTLADHCGLCGEMSSVSSCLCRAAAAGARRAVVIFGGLRRCSAVVPARPPPPVISPAPAPAPALPQLGVTTLTRSTAHWAAHQPAA